MVFYTWNVYNIKTGERDIPCLIDIFIANLVMWIMWLTTLLSERLRQQNIFVQYFSSSSYS